MKLRAFILTAVLPLAACGTMIGGSNTNLEISSNAPDASIYVDGKYQCRAPCIVRLSNSMFQYVFRVEADGYVPEETSLKSTVNVFTTYNTMNLSVGG